MDVQGLSETSGFDITFRPGIARQVSSEAEANRAALLAAYEGITKGDTDTWWALFDPEVAFYEAEGLPYGQSCKGLAAAQQGMGDMFATWKQISIDIEEFAAAGDMVIIYMQMTAVSRKTGKTYSGPVAELFRFRNGRIVEWRPVYWDTHKVREVCGA